MKIKIIYLFVPFFSLSICFKFLNAKNVDVQLTVSVDNKKLLNWKERRKIDVNELISIISNDSKNKIGITCQAVAPMGKWIGSFKNPDFIKNKTILGGQSKTCNLWLIERKEEKDQNKLYTEKSKLVRPRYFAV